MSQTEVQLIKADAVQTADIANSAVSDAKIAGLAASKLTGALPAISGASLTNLPAGGKLLQIQYGVITSNQTFTTSTTFVDTGLNRTITSSANHAGFFIMVSGVLGGVGNTSGGETASAMSLVRTPSGGSDTTVMYTQQGGWAGNVSGQRTEDFGPYAMNYYDTGTSASTEYNYRVQYKKVSDTDNAHFNKYNGRSTIIVIEVGS